MRKTRPSVENLVVCEPSAGPTEDAQSLRLQQLFEHWMSHGRPHPTSLVLHVSARLPEPPPMAAQWLARSLRGVRVEGFKLRELQRFTGWRPPCKVLEQHSEAWL